MKILSVGTLGMILALPLAGQAPRTIYIDRMEGLEPFIEKAFQEAELPLIFVEEEKQPELKANLSRAHSAYGEILYKHKLGRNEAHRLELREVVGHKLIARYTFHSKNDDESRKRAAGEFARIVKKAYANSRR